MYQKFAAVFLTILFMAIVSAPSIIVSVDDSVDVSILLGCAEEEEKENESEKTFELVIDERKNHSSILDFLNEQSQLSYRFNMYPKPHLNLVFPPPEYKLL